MSHWSERAKAVVLFSLAALIYGFGVGRAFAFDDVIYISQNELLRRGDALRVFWFSSEAFNYYPLFWSLLRVQWLLWGDQPLGYHAVNLFVHCVNALLVWRAARALRLPGAWWVAAIFAVHPLYVHTIAWAAEQKNTWSFLFMMLALLAFVTHVRQRDWASYAAAFVLFIAALACKTSTVALPVFLAIYYLAIRGREARGVLLRLIPFVASGIAAGVTTMWFEQNRAGAKSLVATLSLWERVETAGATFWFYLGKTLLPYPLTPMYRGWVDTTAAATTVLPALLLVVAFVLLVLGRRKVGVAPILGLVFYALMLAPLLGIFDTNYFAYSLVADHWQYHALPGAIAAVVCVANTIAKKRPELLRFGNAVGAAAVAALALTASSHFAHFEDEPTLWRYVIRQNPDAWIAWYNLANLQSNERDYRNAIASYRESIRIRPQYYRARFNLANALAASDQLEEADRAFLDARQLVNEDPDAYVNRGVVLLRLGRGDEAETELLRALALDPQKRTAHANLLRLRQNRDALLAANAGR